LALGADQPHTKTLFFAALAPSNRVPRESGQDFQKASNFVKTRSRQAGILDFSEY
jgi:hypothetical protein